MAVAAWIEGPLRDGEGDLVGMYGLLPSATLASRNSDNIPRTSFPCLTMTLDMSNLLNLMDTGCICRAYVLHTILERAHLIEYHEHVIFDMLYVTNCQ